MKLESIHIEGKSFYGIAIPYNSEPIKKAKKLKGRWNPEFKVWLFPFTPSQKEELTNAFNLQDSDELKSSILKEKSKVPREYLGSWSEDATAPTPFKPTFHFLNNSSITFLTLFLRNLVIRR